MIVIAIVVGIAVAVSVAGWVPLVRDALRADHVLPGPSVSAVTPAVPALVDTPAPAVAPAA